MTVSCGLTGGFLLDHEAFVTAVYRQVADEEKPSTDYSLLPGLFAIAKPFRTNGQRSRKRKMLSKEDDQVNGEVCRDDLVAVIGENKKILVFSDDEMKRTSPLSRITVVKNLFHKLREELKIINQDIFLKTDVLEELDVKKLSKQIFETTNFDFGSLQGGNNSAIPLKCKINNELYLIPPMSRFVCGNVVEQVGKLDQQKYDLIIADPPWWNKYIRRLKAVSPSLSYSMMYNEEIASLPVRGVLAAGGLVAVWCTNSPANVRALERLVLPAWGVVPVATWYWLKVTRALEPVCRFGDAAGAKQPYERLVLAAPAGEVHRLPDRRLLVSVPSALHSHKPPLIEVLSPYLQAREPRCLELFARYMLPRTTSLGYEPLKWQHISLYQESNISAVDSG